MGRSGIRRLDDRTRGGSRGAVRRAERRRRGTARALDGDGGGFVTTTARNSLGTKLTVQGWFNLILVIMTLLVCTGAVVGATVLTRSSHITDDLVGRLMPARSEAYQLQAGLVNQETGVRGYALTGDESFLAPYQEGLQTQQR